MRTVSRYTDGFTRKVEELMDEWSETIYEIEDGICSIEDGSEAIIKYLKDIRCSLPLGLELRRYLCSTFGVKDPDDNSYSFKLSDERTLTVSDYLSDDYDIKEDNINDFVDIFLDVNRRCNTDENGNVTLDFTRAEARRLLRLEGACLRGKLFLISFALHMNTDDVHEFLTKVLAEQTYNFRDPYEVIAYFCQSHEDFNSYASYLEFKDRYDNNSAFPTGGSETRDNYTRFARDAVTSSIDTVQELFDFLNENRANFKGYSQTAYDEFVTLYNRAYGKSKIQSLSNDEYVRSSEAVTREQVRERENRLNTAIELQSVRNNEQFVRRMLQFIPRATTEKVKNGKTIVTNDFIPIYNGEGGSSGKKIRTTTLPKEITANLLVRDRLDDLLSGVKPVERKDLVFMKFYLFSLCLEEQDGEYSSADYEIFMEECNDILLRCGMSKLYPANRFENLILLSLLSSNPFEMFENIIESSFINEPGFEKN